MDIRNAMKYFRPIVVGLVGAAGLAAVLFLMRPSEMSYVDSAGKPASRIVSLVTGAVEILKDIDCLERIVAVTNECMIPETLGKARLDADFDRGTVNAEAIVAFAPDLVIANERYREALDGRGLRIYWAPREITVEGIVRIVGDLGRLTGRVDKSDEIIREMRERMASLKKITLSLPPVRVYFEYAGPGHTYGRGTIVDEMIRLAGGINIAGDQKIGRPVIGSESIIVADPEVIVLSPWSPDGVDDVRRRPGWSGISAVKQGRIHKLKPQERSVMLFSHKCVKDAERLFLPWFHPEVMDRPDGGRR